MEPFAVAEGSTPPDPEAVLGCTTDAGIPRVIDLLDGASWRDAAAVWLGTGVLIGLLAFLGRWLVLGHPPDWTELLVPWSGWDGAIYATIATNGYAQPWYGAFYPLFPLLERAVASLTGLTPTTAGILIANLACLPAFALLRVLIQREAGRAVARRTLILLALFPTALFFHAAYTESLFLLLSVAAFLTLRQRRHLSAGALIALATLTRPVGILLLIPLAWECVAQVRVQRADGMSSTQEATRMARMMVAMVLPVAALGGFCLYLETRFGSFSVILQAQAVSWGKHLTWPWVGMAQAAAALGSEPPLYRLHTGLDIAFTLLFVVLSLAALRDLPPAYSLYALASAGLVLLTPAQRGTSLAWATLASNGRYLLIVFPCFWALALWAERPSRRVAFSAPSLLLLVVLTMMFANGTWVA
jgi:Gpi18-like mannosyltransferase